MRGLPVDFSKTAIGALTLFCAGAILVSVGFPHKSERKEAPQRRHNMISVQSAALAQGFPANSIVRNDADNNGHPTKVGDPAQSQTIKKVEAIDHNRPSGEFPKSDDSDVRPVVGTKAILEPSGINKAIAPSGAPRLDSAESQAGLLSDGDENWDSRFVRRGVGERVRAMVWDGAILYAGGDFRTAGGTPASGIAKWDGSSWSALGSGVNGRVNALAWDGANLYVGGEFTTAGGVSAHNIAKWDGSTWSALGSGIGEPPTWGPSGAVFALAWDGANLYAGGRFHVAGGANINSIAKWDGNSWSALGLGTEPGWHGGIVYALAWDGANLYAGGDFWIMGSAVANNIAKWNGSTWSALGSGMKINDWDYFGGRWHCGHVYALAWDGANLYAGGRFKIAGEVPANRMAKWDGNTWSALGTGTNHYVHALAWNGASLFAGGEFTAADGVPASRIAKWNGSTWAPIGAGVNNLVDALALVGPDLYAGGDFSVAGGVTAGHIGRWDGVGWSAMPASGAEVNDTIMALARDGTDLYAGGYFTAAGGVAANRVARWDGVAWSALGSGMDDAVYALVWGGGNLYAGGYFTSAGGVSTDYIAKWDGTAWSALGTGMDGPVHALVWDGANLYAGGMFTTAGGVSANYIAKWDGSAWSALGSGMNLEYNPWWDPPATVHALAWDGTHLYAGGEFTIAGGVSAKSIAKWDDNAWSALGTGMEVQGDFDPLWGLPANVNGLTWDGANIIAGGYFNIAGGVVANYIAKWDGNAWCSLGSGTNYAVNALIMNGTDLYAGGWFTTAGGAPASKIAKWDGSAWSALGSGTNYWVYALAWDGASLFAGGDFSTAGEKVSGSIARWGTCRLPSPPPDIGPVADADACTDTGVLVNWPQDAADWGDGEIGTRAYDVLRNGTVIASNIPYGTTQYLDTTGANGITYTYSVRYRNGCFMNAITGGVPASDDPGPIPIISGPNPACGSASLSTQVYSSYQWYRNGSIIPGATNQNCTASAPGAYSVRIDDGLGCQATSSGFVVNPYPATPIISGPDAGCASTGVVLSSSVYASYQWMKDGMNIPGATAQSYQAMHSGAYQVRATNSAGCPATSAEHMVSISSRPAIVGDHLNACPAVSVTLSTGAYANIQWYINGIPILGATARTYPAAVSGIYSVLATDEHGCEEESDGFVVFVDFCPNTEVSSASAIFPLRVIKSSASGTGYYIFFQRVDSTDGNNIYEGQLITPWDSQYHHAGQPGNDCDAVVTDLGTGEMRAELAPGDGNHYYLVTAFGGGIEGPIGFDSMGSEIPPSQSTCTP